jgi:hypothetical protein
VEQRGRGSRLLATTVHITTPRIASMLARWQLQLGPRVVPWLVWGYRCFGLFLESPPASRKSPLC